MRMPAVKRFGVHRRRGFWLRYFLGGIPFLCLGFGLTPGAAQAQIEVPGPYHLAHLRGVFVDARGNPIQGAAVTLNRDDKVMYSTRTDRAGRFEIKHVSGHYRLHVNMTGYSTVDRQVVVGLEAETYLHGSTLYMIAGPGACTDDCSKVFTSKGKFDHALRESTSRYD
jgi:Carboxypeptidase regulatory-like domain